MLVITERCELIRITMARDRRVNQAVRTLFNSLSYGRKTEAPKRNCTHSDGSLIIA